MFYDSRNSTKSKTNGNVKVQDPTSTVGKATHPNQVPTAFGR